MTKILYIKSSPRGDASYSTRVAYHAINELRRARPHAEIVERDLGRDAPSHIDADRPNAVPVKQLARRGENALAGRSLFGGLDRGGGHQVFRRS